MDARVFKVRGPFGSLIDLSKSDVHSRYRNFEKVVLDKKDFNISVVKFKNIINQRVAAAREKRRSLQEPYYGFEKEFVCEKLSIQEVVCSLFLSNGLFMSYELFSESYSS